VKLSPYQANYFDLIISVT